jgi:hypothetical protein
MNTFLDVIKKSLVIAYIKGLEDLRISFKTRALRITCERNNH